MPYWAPNKRSIWPLFSVLLLYKCFDLDVSCVTQNFKKQNKKILFQSLTVYFAFCYVRIIWFFVPFFKLICQPGHLLSDSKVNVSTIALKLFFLRFVSIVKHCAHSLGKVQTFWETRWIWKNLPHGFDKAADLLSKHQNHQ